MKRLGNVTLKEFREFLSHMGYVFDRTKGGHEIWTKEGTRSIVFQTHIEPLPVSVIKCNLRSMGTDTKTLILYLDKTTQLTENQQEIAAAQAAIADKQ